MPGSLPRPLRSLLLGLLILGSISAASQAQQVFFFKGFLPDTLGPGSVSTLLFELSSSEDVPVTDLAFTDTLPAGVVIANPPNAATTCGPGSVFDAPAGGSTITFSGGQLPPTPPMGKGVACEVTVDVTSSTPGVHVNVSGDLTSNLGNHGDATADLTVTTDRPGFTKSFAPSPITVGQSSTLTFTIDNSANASAVESLVFSDPLPAGLVVADAANVTTDCPFGDTGSISAAPGASVISYSSGFNFPPPFPPPVVSLAAGATCTLSVDVLAEVAGPLVNTSGELTSSTGGPSVSSGKASAVLQVNVEPLIKAFTDDPVPPGGAVTLEFKITNFDRTNAATDIAFMDDLDATLLGLVAVAPLPATPCGPGSMLTGTSVLTLTGGNLPPSGSCTFDVTLQVPAGAPPGSYPNTTSALTATVGGVPTTLNAASDDLVVVAEPILTKEFTDDPVIPGGTVTLEFTITNTSSTSDATDISFLDPFDIILQSAAMTPAPGFCGPGATAAFLPAGLDPPRLSVSGASLAPAGMAGDSCTFSVTLNVEVSAAGGIYPNVTSAIAATVDGSPVTGDPATDDLVVVAPPRLQKEFIDDPVQPGGTVTLELTLTHGEEAASDATAITFTDDLSAALAGLMVIGPLPSTPCGPGSTLSGTTTLTLAGGSLAPGGVCSFSVTLQVPVGAPSGNHVNTTSTVQATVAGVATEGPAATDLLSVAVLDLTKLFLDDPVLPGATVTLQFTIQNLSPSSTATAIQFTDNLDAVLTGLVHTDLPKADVCGPGSSLAAFDPPGPPGATSGLMLSGGVLAPGGSCTFDATLQVPAGAVSDTYSNVTAGFSATVEMATVLFPNATDQLTVDDNLLLFSKEFIDDPVAPGATATLRFTIENLASEIVSALTFSDDLDAALMGLVASGLPMPACGGTLSGTSLLTLTGGTLASGGSCTFDVSIQVPAGAAAGTDAVNTTSELTGTVGGLAVTGGIASDTLRINPLVFTKSFDGPSTATGSPTLTFTITNLDASSVSDIGFTDDLGAVLPGLAAVAPLPTAPCGAGSMLSGTSVLALSLGALAASGQPGDVCMFAVTLEVPAGATPGSFLNTTSSVMSAGLTVAEPASDTLVIEPPPGFGKTFAPDAIGVGQTSTLTFTIVNTASAVAATALDFTDALPAGVVVATPPNASTTCTGGTITAVAATGVIAYSGGSVAAGASCTVQVDVAAMVPGAHINTSGELTSSSGSSGTASDILTADSLPIFTKSFSPTEVELGGTSSVTFTIDNSATSLAATGLAFTDDLPGGMVIASPPNATNTCVGGTLVAVAGGTQISYFGGSVPAGATCSLSVDVAGIGFGSLENRVELTSALGSSGEAVAILVVLGSIIDIPTLGQWSLMLLAVLMLAAGVWRLRG